MVITAAGAAVSACVERSAIGGLLLGGIVMLVNFHLMASIVTRALGNTMRSYAALVAALILKFALFFGSFAVLILFCKIQPLVLILGSGALILAILYDALFPAVEA